MSTKIQLSIRALAEFVLRSGSIDARQSGGVQRGVQGTKLHRMLQKQAGKNYTAELALEAEVPLGDFIYHLTGRADGVLEQDGILTVDEIKTTAEPLEAIEENEYPAHWGQGCLYAYILCQQRGLTQMAVQLRYCHIDTQEVRVFIRHYTAEELQDYTQQLLLRYEPWAKLQTEWKTLRDVDLKQLGFPFKEYRGGQRKLAEAAYRTFRDNGRMLCCAPTGIGKTMSVLFPAMKALGEGCGERIFYLTAKTIARTTAEDALVLLKKQQQLRFFSITLTAKDKVCFLEERNCTPEACPYANGHYDRINDAVYALLQTPGHFGRAEVEAAAEQYKVCPYELSLDLSNWCDCIICDYNYLFDPVVHLQRFFESKGEHLFLIDEAHNLLDRGRDMYSARLFKKNFFELKKVLPKHYQRMHKALAGVNAAFIELRHRCEDAGEMMIQQMEPPEPLARPLEKFTAATEAFLEDNRGSEWENDLLGLYFEVLFYQRIVEGYADNYTTLINKHSSGEVQVRLMCLDPAMFLDGSMAMGRAAVLFSATLQPLPYYKETLGAGEDAKLLSLQSPFPRKNLGLYVAGGISTKYADRPDSLEPLADLLAQMVYAKLGNYIAYFPSYRYMDEVYEAFCSKYPDIYTQCQAPGMDEALREHFLESFAEANEESMLGFCVLGGVFAEGVDLAGDRLIGTAVVGVGLPQIGPETDALRQYYEDHGGHGFEYAYQFPGMNKVLQAAGRVIRTPKDKGVVLLADSRYPSGRYQAMFPQHWNGWKAATTATLQQELRAFWGVDKGSEKL